MSTPANAFVWPLRVYYEDTDAQGVVYYANYFRFMERARTEWIRDLGIEQDRLLERDRLLFVVVATDARFRRPARFNDRLNVTVEMQERSRASFLLKQDILRDDERAELLVSGTVRAACLDADTRRPTSLPDQLFKELPQ